MFHAAFGIACQPKVTAVLRASANIRIKPGTLSLSIARMYSATSSIDSAEVAKFAAASNDWWKPNGQFGMLHQMNPVRMKYIRTQTLSHLASLPVSSASTLASVQPDPAAPFKGLRVLDVGCGGGLLSESLARLGASVTATAIDASPENVAMAAYHASLDPMLNFDPKAPFSLSFRAITAEELLRETGSVFDLVCSLEVVEHVNNPKEFIGNCLELVKPNGLAIFSTINRTPTARLFTILLAENILKWVPVGTHNFDKYITPTELESFVKAVELSSVATIKSKHEIADVSGLAYRPLENKWELLDGKNSMFGFGFAGDLEMNYVMSVRKLAVAA
ncbi:hypothetical protein HK100_004717 [Physocladia obscura]|uniref:Ubiquinone biosynthesis O-methyltransferase, mitochondrial n=1 Tax=Physocladia obscura TaxID=109957 RepID=A0AAD5X9S0_9FUNG|nr:hypothetical protein HK100_004717 [Physocladia obscura]